MKHPMPLNWRKYAERYNLYGTRCETCGTAFFPGRKICPNCRRKGKMVEEKMPEQGKIVSFTRVHTGPSGFKHETPYFLAIIELDNRARLLAQIVDTEPEQVKIGTRVKRAFRKIMEPDKKGVISYGYKFRITE